MAQATWRVLALSALACVVASAASAQVVIGGSGQPDVVVNWSVLDRLGPQPNVADLLRKDLPTRTATAPAIAPGAKAPQALVYKPFQSGKAAPKKQVTKAKPTAAKPVPVVAAVAVDKPAAEPAPQPAAAAAPVKPPAAEVPATPAAAKPQAVEAKPALPSPGPAAVSAPVPVAVAPPPAVPAQVASLPSAEPAVARDDILSMVFDPDSPRLGERARADLQVLAKRMLKNEDLGLQVLAYAAGDEESASKARRLSLSRALEVRKVLMDLGVRSTRIEVRALGNKQDGRGPADRVDAVLVAR